MLDEPDRSLTRHLLCEFCLKFPSKYFIRVGNSLAKYVLMIGLQAEDAESRKGVSFMIRSKLCSGKNFAGFHTKKKKIEISIIVIRKVTFRFLKTPFEQYTALVWAHFCSPRYNTLVMCLARFTMKILGMRKDCLWFEKAQEWEDWTPKGAPFVSFLEDNNASSHI